VKDYSFRDNREMSYKTLRIWEKALYNATRTAGMYILYTK